MTTKSGTKVKIPTSATSNISKKSIAKAATKAFRMTPGGFAAGILADALIDEGIKRCQANQLDFCKEDPQFPDIPPNYTWTIGGNLSQTFTSAEAACNAFFAAAGQSSFPAAQWTYETVMTSQTTAKCRARHKTDTWYFQDAGTAISVPKCPDGYQEKILINGDKYCTKIDNPKVERPATDPEIEKGAEDAQGKKPGLSPNLAEGARKDGHSPDKPEFGPTPGNISAPPVTSAPRETGRQVVTNPDGSTSTKTTTEQTTVTPKTTGTTTGDTRITHYTTNTTTTTTIVNNITNETTTIVDTENSDDTPNAPGEGAEGPKECGSPGRPKCQIDETGTPTDTQTPFAGPNAELTKSQADALQQITTGTDTNKDTGWKFSFAFPTGCSPITMFLDVVVDMCRYTSMIHDLMSLVWYAATVFGIIGMFGRTLGGSNA